MMKEIQKRNEEEELKQNKEHNINWNEFGQAEGEAEEDEATAEGDEDDMPTLVGSKRKSTTASAASSKKARHVAADISAANARLAAAVPSPPAPSDVGDSPSAVDEALEDDWLNLDM